MLNLSHICLAAVCGTKDAEYVTRTLRVLDWCCSWAHWNNVMVLSVLPVPDTFNYKGVQIPEINGHDQWQIFTGRVAPALFTHYPYVMQIHEDGFPTHPELWKEEFSDYDYIAAPWHDDVIGSGGMCLSSRLFNECVAHLPWYAGDGNADEWQCRRSRERLEQLGVTFAPAELAHTYCTESMRKEQPSFGFHGRRDCAEKYKAAWAKIEAWEKQQPGILL